MFKKLKSIFRVLFLGLVGIFSTVFFLLSYHPAYAWYSITDIPAITLYSCFSMVTVSSYFFYKWDVINWEYQILKKEYLDWISKQKSLTVFFVSIPVNLLITLCQLGLIKIILHFTHLSIPAASNISLFFVNIVNFFIIRTYIFRYENKNYFHQIFFYSFFTIIGLIVNNKIVELLVSNFEYLKGYFLVESISIIIGDNATPQFITSALVGWIWFKCHEKITFRKINYKNMLGFLK